MRRSNGNPPNNGHDECSVQTTTPDLFFHAFIGRRRQEQLDGVSEAASLLTDATTSLGGIKTTTTTTTTCGPLSWKDTPLSGQ